MFARHRLGIRCRPRDRLTFQRFTPCALHRCIRTHEALTVCVSRALLGASVASSAFSATPFLALEELVDIGLGMVDGARWLRKDGSPKRMDADESEPENDSREDHSDGHNGADEGGDATGEESGEQDKGLGEPHTGEEEDRTPADAQASQGGEGGVGTDSSPLDATLATASAADVASEAGIVDSAQAETAEAKMARLQAELSSLRKLHAEAVAADEAQRARDAEAAAAAAASSSSLLGLIISWLYAVGLALEEAAIWFQDAYRSAHSTEWRTNLHSCPFPDCPLHYGVCPHRLRVGVHVAFVCYLAARLRSRERAAQLTSRARQGAVNVRATDDDGDEVPVCRICTLADLPQDYPFYTLTGCARISTPWSLERPTPQLSVVFKALLFLIAGFAGSEVGQLVSPCLCAGSMRFVHLECLTQWRTTSTNPLSFVQCEQCLYKYSFRRALYASVLRSALVLHFFTLLVLAAILLLCSLLTQYLDQQHFDGTLGQYADLLGLGTVGSPEMLGVIGGNPAAWLGVDPGYVLASITVIGVSGFLTLGMLGPVLWPGRGHQDSIMIFVVIIGLARAFILIYDNVKRRSGFLLREAEKMVVDVGASPPEAAPQPPSPTAEAAASAGDAAATAIGEVNAMDAIAGVVDGGAVDSGGAVDETASAGDVHRESQMASDVGEPSPVNGATEPEDIGHGEGTTVRARLPWRLRGTAANGD